MNTCYIVVDGMFNEGYLINKVFDSFDKAEKYILNNITYIERYKRKNKTLGKMVVILLK